MHDNQNIDPRFINIHVEFFGSARILTGLRETQISIPKQSTLKDLTHALSDICPELIGEVILADRSGLQKSYVFNVNGVSFISNEPLNLTNNDVILLFSSQAGG